MQLTCTGQAFLAQSPQLAKQMCIAGDMERVYEIAPGMLFHFVRHFAKDITVPSTWPAKRIILIWAAKPCPSVCWPIHRHAQAFSRRE